MKRMKSALPVMRIKWKLLLYVWMSQWKKWRMMSNEWRVKKSSTRKVLYFAASLLFYFLASFSAYGQGSRKDDIIFNSRGTPLAGATIRVCAQPATGQPCTPLALIYSDAGLTQALANPTTTDGLGNYHFYAAPGKYMTEISGPGITTKQIPDVLIPADPSSPTYTGNISAFSLTLSGNLSVNGNTTVLGNLASGTLNLSNQSTAPGAASTGTVNLYTKTADKRLYYKDETGAEVGPLGTGVQANASNTFTAPQNIDSDFHTKGPNPAFDLTRYGGYLSANQSPPAITCSTVSGNPTITCAGGTSDFAVSHGVAIATAGVAPQVGTPGAAVNISGISVSSNTATVATANNASFTNGSTVTIAGSTDSAFNGNFVVVQQQSYNQFTFAVTHANCSPCTIGSSATVVAQTSGIVTPQGILNGTTNYSYKVVAVDYSGGLSPASQAYTTTAGAAVLGLNTATITQYQRSSGVVTFTTSAVHNFQSGSEINVIYNNSGGRDAHVEGAFVINSVPSSTTFTILQTGVPDSMGAVTVNDTAQITAKNLVQWTMQPGITMGHIVYRCAGASCTNYAIVGYTQGMDSAFTDWGFSFNPAVLPSYFPAAPPSSATNGILSAQITAINGTQITLAANAGATLASATVLHDNSANVIAACTASTNNGQGGTVYFPGSSPQGNLYLFNSPLRMTACPAYTKLQFGATIWLNQPVLARSVMEVEGLGQGSGGNVVSFVTDHTARILGEAYPFFLLGPGGTLGGSSVTFSNLALSCNQFYQSCVVQDQDNGGNNVTEVYYRNVYMGGNVGSQPFKLGGGFGFHFDRGGIFVSGATGWGFPPEFLDVVQQGLGANSQQLVGIFYMDRTYISGGEMLFDAAGVSPLSAGPGHMWIRELLNESGYYPSIRFNTGNNTVFNVTIENASYSDALGGFAVPLIEMTTAASVSAFRVFNPSCFNGFQPLFTGASPGGVEVTNGTGGCSVVGMGTYLQHFLLGSQMIDQYVNAPVQFSGVNGQAFIAMQTPAAPTVSISGASGPAAGTYFYTVLAKDVNGNRTLVSPASSGITVSGSQGVLVQWTLVPGQVATDVCRGPSATSQVCAVVGAGFNLSGTSFLDNGGFFPSGSVPSASTAGSSAIGQSGLTTTALKLSGGGFASIVNGTFTSTRTQTLPDNTGYIPVSSYLNSAYDNATRANGAIGTNWTVQQNGLNIAANQIQGTTAAASNTAFWNVNAFSTVQFSQATITGLNGASDFPGVTVLASGTGGSSTYYDCVENSTTIYIQRVVNTGTTNLTNTASTGALGDILRLEVTQNGVLTCFKNGAVALTTTDTQITSGSPGLLISGNVATMKNWSGGNLHPLMQADIEADYTKVQHLNAGIGMGTETFTSSPRAEQNVFLPGALTSTWTGATWTTDKAISVTRIQVQAKTAPAGCTTNAIVRFTDGTSPVNLTITSAANDSGAITQNYAAGSALQVLVQTAAAGCTTSPADANVVVQYRMQ